jgi:hypothetical protein
MLAGLFIAVPVWLFAYVPADWQPHGWLMAAILALPVFGIMWFYDELAGN